MPFYDYKCPKCGLKLIDVFRKITENVAEEECPRCFGVMKQKTGKPIFKLSGSGWAKDGYSSTSKKDSDG